MTLTPKRSILVIEDDPDITTMVAINLRGEGYAVEAAADGETGLAALATTRYDALILDLTLPGIDGLEICRQLRTRAHYTPIIIISSKSAEAQRIVGLEMGADDYLCKPFSVLELIARVRALLRRVDALTHNTLENADTMLISANLRMDTQSRSVHLDERPVPLTTREFELLHFFVRHPNRIFTRMELLNQVWGYTHDGYEHTVNSHINRLRAKIESDPANPQLIITVWGMGYKFSPSASVAASA